MPALAAALLIAVAAWRGAPTAQLSWGAAAAAPRLAAPRAGSRPGPRGSAIADGADPARAKLIKGGLPQKFAERVSFQTGGAKKAGQEEILILWREFKKCYPNEKVPLGEVPSRAVSEREEATPAGRWRSRCCRRTRPSSCPPSTARPSISARPSSNATASRCCRANRSPTAVAPRHLTTLSRLPTTSLSPGSPMNSSKGGEKSGYRLRNQKP